MKVYILNVKVDWYDFPAVAYDKCYKLSELDLNIVDYTVDEVFDDGDDGWVVSATTGDGKKVFFAMNPVEVISYKEN